MFYLIITLEIAVILTVVAIESFAIATGAATLGLALAISRGIVALPAATLIFQYLEFQYGRARWSRVTKVVKIAGGVAFVFFTIVVGARYLQTGTATQEALAKAQAATAVEMDALSSTLSRLRAELALAHETARSSDLEAQLADSQHQAAKEAGKERGGCGKVCRAAEQTATALRERITAARARETLEARVTEAETRLRSHLDAKAEPAVTGFQILTYDLGTSVRDLIILTILALSALAVMALPNAFSDVLHRLAAHRRGQGHLARSAGIAVDVAFEDIPAPVTPVLALPAADPIKAFLAEAAAQCPAGEWGLTVSELRDACRAYAAAKGYAEPCAATAKFGGPLAKAMGVAEIETGTGRRTRLRLTDEWQNRLRIGKPKKRTETERKTEKNGRKQKKTDGNGPEQTETVG
jgi:hypothetical protein